jgi:hypothetical protein
MTEDLLGYKILRVLVKDGHVMPGLPGYKPFKPKGDGITTCYWCGKLLTDQLSFARGVGPECIKEHGCMPGREWIEEFAKPFKVYQAACKRANRQIKSFKEWHEKHIKRGVIKI